MKLSISATAHIAPDSTFTFMNLLAKHKMPQITLSESHFFPYVDRASTHLEFGHTQKDRLEKLFSLMGKLLQIT